jgi:hypothetical protein
MLAGHSGPDADGNTNLDTGGHTNCDTDTHPDFHRHANTRVEDVPGEPQPPLLRKRRDHSSDATL